MKKGILAASLLVMGAQLIAEGQRPPAGPIGSFQIIAGRYSVTGIAAGGGDIVEEGIFRMDTRTGQTWVYMTGMDPQGKVYDGWGLVRETVVRGK